MFFVEVIDGIKDYLRSDDYFLVLSCAKSDGVLETIKFFDELGHEKILFVSGATSDSITQSLNANQQEL